ncbi:MAG: flagellar basal body-associated FliL family protein [Liquorilactobacillus sp.]|uniref:flagellar basal body-associated FliL family protein n=1 Tax=Liquorilactobacillus nagelii TaxID=82688 RepID=UPI0039ED4A95
MAKEEGRPKKKKWFIIVLLILILAIVGGIAGDYFANKVLNKTKVEKKITQTGGIASNQELISLNKFLVNLASDSSNSQQYISIKISLVVAKDNAKRAKKNVALIRDSVINVLRQKKESDILSGTNGTTDLKNEIQNTINQNYGNKVVNKVFITDMVIQ